MSKDPRQPSLFDAPSTGMVADLFEPARLTQARVLAGMTKQDLADKLGVSPAAVGQYEAGITRPRPDHIETLSSTLDFPVAFFAGGRPYARLDSSMAHFRSLRTTRVGERAKATALVEQLWELTFALEKRVELPPVDLPIAPPGASLPVGAEPEAVAREVRRQWGIDKGPLRHLVRTMELRGVIVSVLSFAGDDVARVDAFCTSRLPRPVVILTPDRANDIYRHRFTAAHELGHLMLHADIVPGDLEQEREASRFAAELLTPAAEIERELPSRFRMAALEELSRVWGVSPASLVRRSKELGVISDVSARRAYQRVQQLRSAGLMRPDTIAGYPGETPTLLPSAFELAEQHGLSLKELANELAWPLRRVRQLLGMDDSRPALRLVAPSPTAGTSQSKPSDQGTGDTRTRGNSACR
ncbi:XRE family transcriptional regulator [Lentzea albida]|uniref:Zn-dependent peptidase ImmA, M78 family n=1 Tax=Lentzea albida TaxID=65499 RepID=A0A1H9X1B5_9PSEU|nr:XRE family transcriptional regulator [Lentzea albida]SES39998.1 Zn-dependent peptidase ImmA, M78 family [Lentzea albida]